MCVFFYKNEKLFPKQNSTSRKYNEELIEIKDKQLLKKVKQELNLNFEELSESNPFICGTIVNGSFTRKLKMVRADMYSILSVVNSHHIIKNSKQQIGIKKGVIEFVKNIQFSNIAYNRSKQRYWR